jgi:hypothetical protein
MERGSAEGKTGSDQGTDEAQFNEEQKAQGETGNLGEDVKIAGHDKKQGQHNHGHESHGGHHTGCSFAFHDFRSPFSILFCFALLYSV